MVLAVVVEQGRLAEAIGVLADAVQSLDVAVITGDDAARLTELFARGERLCLASKAVAARRATERGEGQGVRIGEDRRWIINQEVRRHHGGRHPRGKDRGSLDHADHSWLRGRA